VAVGLYGVWMPMAGFERFRPFVDAAEVVSIASLLMGLASAGLTARLARHVTRGVRRALAVGTVMALVSSGAFVHYVHALSGDLPDPPPMAVGAAAPSVVAKDFLGQEFDLRSLRGKPAVVLFYRGHW
jgi:cytochrome oxidase Cu insertion factor (SCO1/SenC/PrrC family)